MADQDEEIPRRPVNSRTSKKEGRSASESQKTAKAPEKVAERQTTAPQGTVPPTIQHCPYPTTLDLRSPAAPRVRPPGAFPDSSRLGPTSPEILPHGSQTLANEPDRLNMETEGQGERIEDGQSITVNQRQGPDLNFLVQHSTTAEGQQVLVDQLPAGLISSPLKNLSDYENFLVDHPNTTCEFASQALSKIVWLTDQVTERQNELTKLLLTLKHDMNSLRQGLRFWTRSYRKNKQTYRGSAPGHVAIQRYCQVPNRDRKRKAAGGLCYRVRPPAASDSDSHGVSQTEQKST
ncbi:hypothetical protein AYL99_11831 [Fonsecaea erecta]|uniref:Uncharacterized protein n=1 Tax=Fonsecaea erecta TaxID=1367422 RepID=A0A178Z358_9EURO|nr:hypothetical protein AYL99_11831 [Fonsecaea erecta]OAP53951.1 hypothetical protein AYL99_11831 [Fonsecaea erecta]